MNEIESILLADSMYKEGYQQGRADAIESCIEILARLVTMELLDLNTYELVKAELKEQKNECVD